MNGISFFLAHRIIFTNSYKKTISTMSIICFLGIFIGTFSLTLVTAIMRGFEEVIHKKIQGIHSHIIIDAYKKPINFKLLSKVLHEEFPEISSFSPHTERNALIRPYNNDNTIPTVIIIKSINPELEMLTSSLFAKIIKPTNSNNLAELFKKDTIIIGKNYANSNNLTIGDTIELLFSGEDKIQGKTVSFESQYAYIGGIFDTGIDEFDSNVIYCSFSFLKNMFLNAEVETVNVKLQLHINESDIIKKLQTRLGLSVYSWKDLYPSLVATLKLEKYVSFFVLALIILVASMNIISVMHMHITQKRSDIALLKAIAMPNSIITTIFFIIGMFLTFSAPLCGIVTALITSYIIKHYPFISLPDTYYTTHLPIAMELYIIFSVVCVVLFFSFMAIYFSTQQIKSIQISHVLRF